jgi:hypothetical protein
VYRQPSGRSATVNATWLTGAPTPLIRCLRPVSQMRVLADDDDPSGFATLRSEPHASAGGEGRMLVVERLSHAQAERQDLSKSAPLAWGPPRHR